jgi:hypothetical protein
MKTFVLHHSMRLLPYFGPSPKVAVKYLKQLLLLWGSGEEGPRLLAFLSIREMALVLPHPMLDLVLKVPCLPPAVLRLTGSAPSMRISPSCARAISRTRRRWEMSTS